MFYTYLLISQKDHHWYTGSTGDLKKRLGEHNSGKNFSTKSRRPFHLVYYEACFDRSDAEAREKFFKSGPGKRFLKNRLRRFFSTNLNGFVAVNGLWPGDGKPLNI